MTLFAVLLPSSSVEFQPINCFPRRFRTALFDSI